MPSRDTIAAQGRNSAGPGDLGQRTHFYRAADRTTPLSLHLLSQSWKRWVLQLN